MIKRDRKERGQVIVMVTFALFAMVGLMGLAVDLGWSYFTKKSAQAAADSAALAAAQQAFVSAGEGDDAYTCGTGVTCQAATSCPGAGNIQNGCLYAQQNGFSVTEGGRQNVTMEANTTYPIPTAPGVHPYYWVTARVSERVPQLFSSILGNTSSLVSARATAAVIDSSVMGSLILLNRESDCVPMDNGGQTVCGVDLLVQANNNQGMDAVRADGGVLLASNKHGVTADGRWAGENQGGGVVRAPYTFIRDQGYIVNSNNADWIQMPQNGYSDRAIFKDPMRGLGQPPPPTLAEAPAHPITLGNLLGGPDEANPVVYQPGSYYAVDGNGKPTGDPLTVHGYIRFASDSGGFGDYVFYGGLRNQSGGTVVEFDPGRYVIAGVTPQGQNPKPLFDVQTNMTIQDGTQTFNQAPPNAGEIFIFTDTSYPGLQPPPQLAGTQAYNSLQMGISGFQTGNNADISINIHGLNRASDALPEELKPFSPVVLWQDQHNSVVKYTPQGYIDTSCGNNASTGCPNTALANPASVEMFFKASPALHIWGVAYQPRGAFTSMVGGGGYDSPLQLIAGALKVHANSNLRLAEINQPLFIKKVALVE